MISATAIARRGLGHLDLRLDGNLRNGDSLGKHTFKLGPVERGRSLLLVVARPDRRLCRSRHHFTLRVRPVWPALVGKPAQATSRFKGAVRNGARAPTPLP